MKALLHNGFTGYELTEIPLPIPEEHEICIAVKYCEGRTLKDRRSCRC
jgi:D-arabinose 1-dehydrogenase-like Zn-dependent alcohol dehydrogenase